MKFANRDFEGFYAVESDECHCLVSYVWPGESPEPVSSKRGTIPSFDGGLLDFRLTKVNKKVKKKVYALKTAKSLSIIALFIPVGPLTSARTHRRCPPCLRGEIVFLPSLTRHAMTGDTYFVRSYELPVVFSML